MRTGGLLDPTNWVEQLTLQIDWISRIYKWGGSVDYTKLSGSVDYTNGV